MTHITIERSKLEQALAALKRMKKFGDTFGYRASDGNPYEQVCEAIDVCEQAIAAPVQEPVALHEMAKRRVFDAIRGAYDLGFNDARNARTTPGDSLPGYKGRDVEADHGGALISALERYTTPPAAPVQDDLLVGYFKQDDFRRWVECSPLSSGAQAFYATTPPAAPVHHPAFAFRECEDSQAGSTPPAAQPADQKEWVETACALIKAADDAAADRDYMLDSNDCIRVLRGEWKGEFLNDMPKQPTPPAAQPAPTMTYSIDADPIGIRKRAADAIIGALALGSQDSSPPPEGHWLKQFWDIGRAEALKATPLAAQPADQGQSCYCPNCEALSKQLAAQPAVPLSPDAVNDMVERHAIEGDERYWYVVGITDSEAAHGITKGGAA